MGVARKIAVVLREKYGNHWFAVWLAVRVFVVLVFAHWYDSQVFADVALRLASGHGVYAIGGEWRTSSFNGEGYFTYPPIYGYLLAVSGLIALWFSAGTLVLKILVKLWLFLADILVFSMLNRVDPFAARSYWTMWFVPIAAIGLLQSDVIVGLLVLGAFLLAKSGRHVPAAVAIGLGAATKYVPLLIVPFLCVYFLRIRQKRVALSYATLPIVSFAAAWFPYVLLYGDATHFLDAVQYQGSRIGGGMNPLVLFHFVVFVLGFGNSIVGPTFDATNFIAALPLLTRLYSILFGGVLIAFLVWYSRRKDPSVEQAFLFPLLTFLFAAPLVNEQFIMMVLPLLLLVRSEVAKRLWLPFSAYFLAAGTPLRFLPTEIVGNANQVLITGGGPPFLIQAIFLAMLGTALFFNLRLGGLLAREMNLGRRARSPRLNLKDSQWIRRIRLNPLLGTVAERVRRLGAISLVLIVASMAIGTAVFVGIQLRCPIDAHVLTVEDTLGLGAGSEIELAARNVESPARVLAFAALWPGLGIEEPWISTNASPVLAAGAEETLRLIPLRASGAIPSGTAFSMKVYFGSFDNYCVAPSFLGPRFNPPLMVNPFLRFWEGGQPFGWTLTSQGDSNDLTRAQANQTAGFPAIVELMVNQSGPPATSDWAEIRISQLVVDLPVSLNMTLFPTFIPTTSQTMPTSGFGFTVDDGVNRIWYVFGASAPAVFDYPALRVVAISGPLNTWSTYQLTRADVIRNFQERGWVYHEGLDFGLFAAAYRNEPGMHIGFLSVANATE